MARESEVYEKRDRSRSDNTRDQKKPPEPKAECPASENPDQVCREQSESAEKEDTKYKKYGSETGICLKPVTNRVTENEERGTAQHGNDSSHDRDRRETAEIVKFRFYSFEKTPQITILTSISDAAGNREPPGLLAI